MALPAHHPALLDLLLPIRTLHHQHILRLLHNILLLPLGLQDLEAIFQDRLSGFILEVLA